MSTVLDLAIALSLKDLVSGQIGNIIDEFKRLEGVSDEVKDKLNDFKNIGIAGGTLFGAGAFGLDKTLDILDEITNEAASFEDSMVVLMNKSLGKNLVDPSYKDQIKEVEAYFADTAMMIGSKTTFDSADILDSMTELVKGGIEYEEVINSVAEANAYFAQVNRVAATAVAEGTVQMKSGFRLVGDEVMDAMEIINQYADATIADSLALQRVLGNVAGTASTIWQGRDRLDIVKETIALTAITTNVTGDENSAATYVRNFLDRANMDFNNMSAPQIQAMLSAGWLTDVETVMKKNGEIDVIGGKSIFIDYENGMLKSIEELEAILEETRGKMSNVDFSNILDTVFQDRGKKVAEALADTTIDLNALNIDWNPLDGVTGPGLKIVDQAELEMDRFNAAKDTFEENISNFKKVIGAPFLEPGKNIFKGLSEQIERVTKYFKQHPDVTKFIFSLAGGISVFLMITGVIMGVIGAVGSLKLVWGIAGKAIISAMAPVIGTMLPVMAIVAAIAGAGFLIYKNWDKVGPIINDIGNIFKNAFALILSIFNGGIDTDAWSSLSKTLEKLGFSSEQASRIIQQFVSGIKIFKDVFITVKDAVVSVISALYNIIKTVFINILSFIRQNAGTIKQVFITVWSVLSAFLKPIISYIASMIKIVFNGIKDFFVKWGPTISEIFSNAFQLIFLIGKMIFERIRMFWETWGSTIIAVFQGTLNHLKIIFETVFNIIKIVAGYILGTINNIIKFFLAVLKGDWEGAWNAIKDQFTLWKDTIFNIVNTLVNGFTEAFANMKNTIGNIFNGLVDAATNIVRVICDAIGGLKDKAAEWGFNLIESFVDGIASALNKIPDVLKGAAETIKSWIGVASPTKEGPLKNNHLWGGNLIKSFADGMINSLPMLKSTISHTSKVVDDIPKSFNFGINFILNEEEIKSMLDMREKFKEWGGNLIKSFAEGMIQSSHLLQNASELASSNIFLNETAALNLNEQMDSLSVDLGISGTQAGQAFTDGFNDPQVVSAIKATVETINNTVTDNLIAESDMRTWGQNLIQSFINGMKSKFAALEQTLKEAASLVGDYMKVQSPTKKGDLSTNNLWGGNLIKSFAEGMIQSSYLLQSASALASSSIFLNGTAALNFKQYDIPMKFKQADEPYMKIKSGNQSGKANNDNASPVHIHIYPAKNHDENKIADIVIKKIKKQNRGKTQTSKSSLVMSPNGYKGGY